MSVSELLGNPVALSFIAATFLTLVSAVAVIWHKSIVYAAFFLSMLGVGNAILMTLLGYPVIALFHLVVYVGAAVTFILFSVVMLREAPMVELKERYLALIALALLSILLLYVFSGYVGMTSSYYVSYKEITALLVEKYWFALIIAAIALVTTLIEAITLARKEVVS